MTVAVIVKGWPRLSETFIAQEVLGLERRGLRQVIVSLRHPTDKTVHDLNRRVTAPVTYLPEYLHDEPARVLRAVQAARRMPEDEDERPVVRPGARAWGGQGVFPAGMPSTRPSHRTRQKR